MNWDHSVIFEIAPKYCILDSLVDYDGYSISYKEFLPTVVNIMVYYCVQDGLPQRDNQTTPTCEGLWHSWIFCGANSAVPSTPHLLLTDPEMAQKFTFREAGVTYRCDIFVCWFDKRYSISLYPWNDWKEVKVTSPYLGFAILGAFAGVKCFFSFDFSPPTPISDPWKNLAFRPWQDGYLRH